jgi:uncharacterized protein YdhG (YjbR/CyaY superfamily)
VQSALHLLRGAIRNAVPEAQEVISYGMPTYKLHGSRMLQFAAWRSHYSLYTATDQVAAEFKELKSYRLQRGTIQFPIAALVPVELIERIARYRSQQIRAKQIAARDEAKASKPKQR